MKTHSLKHPVHLRGLLCSCVLAMLTLSAPLTGFAQDDGMSFDEEEASGDGMSFDEGEEVAEEAEPEGEEVKNALETTGGKTIAVVALPSPDMEPGQQQELQEALTNAMALTKGKGYDVRGPSGIPAGLADRGEECSREPICLASVGGEAGVNKILIGRFTKLSEGNYRLDVDLFDVDDRLFLNNKGYDNLDDFGDAEDKTEDAIRYIFEIRTKRDGRVVDTTNNDGIIQPVFAYTTAGLAVLSLAGGIYYGMEAGDQEAAILEQSKNGDGRFETQTQREASDAFKDAESTAATANIFYGVALGLGALSAVLFVVDFGSDVASEEELNDRRSSIRDLSIAPSVSTESVGVGTFFRF